MSSTVDPPTLRYSIGDVVCVGDRIGSIHDVQSGPGTRVQGGHVYASLVGILMVNPITLQKIDDDDNDTNHDHHHHHMDHDDSSSESKTLSTVFVCSVQSSKPKAASYVLHVGQLILGTISRITPQNALVDIAVLEQVGPTPFAVEGAIRMDDIRGVGVAVGGLTGNNDDSTALSFSIGDAFQPGDKVACRVLSMGDPRRYFLTTAETELGVLQAFCKDCKTTLMVPMNWKEMQCPNCDATESRKCAKPGGGLSTLSKKQ